MFNHGYPRPFSGKNGLVYRVFRIIGALWEVSTGSTGFTPIQRNRSKSQQNGPMVPHAGEQDDGSFLQNSIKLAHSDKTIQQADSNNQHRKIQRQI